MYIHKVYYYETDKMGITHHSNYIRWMEEARTAFLEDIGWSYDRLEDLGIVSPVVSVQCDYKKTSTFNDRIAIDVKIEKYNSVRLVVSYTMTNADTGDTVAVGSSSHCFLNKDGMVIRLIKEAPEFDRAMAELIK